jgi:hypothetical protein
MLTESSLRLQMAAIPDFLRRRRYRFPVPMHAAASAVLASAVLVAVAGFSPCAPLATAQQLPADANEFVRDVLQHEIDAELQDHALWAYREQKIEDGKEKLFRVYQTPKGEIERLIAVNGYPLTPAQIQAEDERIQKLISHPSEMRQHQKKAREDGEQAHSLLRMFSDAFLFQYDGTQGTLVRLRFTPNPKFHPPSHATQVFHHMTGTMLLEPKQKRLAAIDGTLTSEVKFAGGLFGHLDKGGTFAVHQQEVGPHLWEVTSMHVHVNGRALLFKAIAVQQDEIDSDFHPVPDNTTLSQAAEFLRQDAQPPQVQAKN